MVSLDPIIWAVANSFKYPGGRQSAYPAQIIYQQQFETNKLKSIMKKYTTEKTTKDGLVVKENATSAIINTVRNISNSYPETEVEIGKSDKTNQLRGEIRDRTTNTNTTVSYELNADNDTNETLSNLTKRSNDPIYADNNYASESLHAIVNPEYESGNSQASSVSEHRNGRASDPWAVKNGRCLSFENVLDRGYRTFRYAADQCGYDQYYVCQQIP